MALPDFARHVALGALVLFSSACEARRRYADPPPDSYSTALLTIRRSGTDTTVNAARIDPSFLRAAHVQALLGRMFIDADYAPSGRVALLSDAMWRGALLGEPTVIGRPIMVNGDSLIVVGVLAADFNVPPGTALWVPRTAAIGR
jgi:hypothetical protein